MFRFFTAPTVTAVAVAAFVAGLAVFLTSGAPEAKAESLVKPALHQASPKNGHLRAFVTEAACSSRGWPHYEQRCLFDLRRPANKARAARVIALR